MTGVHAHESQQALEVLVLMDTLVQPDDDAARKLGRSRFDGQDLADDQFRRLAPAVQSATDEADQVVLDQAAELRVFLGPKHGWRRTGQVFERELGHPRVSGAAL